MSSVVNSSAEKVASAIEESSGTSGSAAAETTGMTGSSLWNHLSMAANITLLVLCGYLVYKIYKVCRQPAQPPGLHAAKCSYGTSCTF